MPILPRHRHFVPDGLLDVPAGASGPSGRRPARRTTTRCGARAANRGGRWIPGPGARMLVGDLRTNGRLVAPVRLPSRAASIGLEHVDLERL